MNTFLNNPIDISEVFQKMENEYYIPSTIKTFDVPKAKGTVEWRLHRYSMDWFFNKIDKHLSLQNEKAAPFQDYDLHPACDFEISFISQRTLRLRMKTTVGPRSETPSLMIDDVRANTHEKWKSKQLSGDEVLYLSNQSSVAINTKTFSIKIYDEKGKLLTSTKTLQELKAMHTKAMPFSFARKTDDYSRNIAASFTLYPDEKIVGCGESFTSLNKRGQKICIFAADAQSSASQQMYKPIPFFLSSRGYGMFVHTSAPVTMDFGHTQAGTNTIYSGDDFLDMFFFIGSPAEVLHEYTLLTGRSPLPPLWSFGLWMGCFSYTSEKEVRKVAEKMRKQKFPCDVIHIDSGWFEKGINCDFKFNKKTFPDPEKMISDLKKDGFRTSLWQIPYFTPHNPVYDEVAEKKLFVKDLNGNIPTEDAILDFSNEETIKWYREKLSALLRKGISAIKVDFGEAAPVKGIYASGKTGWHEHSLYPLRYNKIVSDLTKELHDEHIIWARSAYAGSQKYPVHWGGDSEVSDTGMAGSLRGGLSLGLSGFSFWSHDIGGFSGSPVEELFGRWSFFGLMSSHSRVHGFPPREPWHYSPEFQTIFRGVSMLRYRLMPYIYAQAAMCSSEGLPLMKALLLNYPDDPTAWTIEDQYLLGNDILIAPLMEENTESRKVYLPEGKWVDHASKTTYEGKQWHEISAGVLKGIILYRWGAMIPTIALAGSTAFMEWDKVTLVAISDGTVTAHGPFFAPGMEAPEDLEIVQFGEQWELLKSNLKQEISATGYQLL